MPALNEACAAVLKVAAVTPVRVMAALTVRMVAVAEALTAATVVHAGPLRPGGQTFGLGDGGGGGGGFGGGLGGDGGDGDGGGGGDGGGATDLTTEK